MYIQLYTLSNKYVVSLVAYSLVMKEFIFYFLALTPHSYVDDHVAYKCFTIIIDKYYPFTELYIMHRNIHSIIHNTVLE